MQEREEALDRRELALEKRHWTAIVFSDVLHMSVRSRWTNDNPGLKAAIQCFLQWQHVEDTLPPSQAFQNTGCVCSLTPLPNPTLQPNIAISSMNEIEPA